MAQLISENNDLVPQSSLLKACPPNHFMFLVEDAADVFKEDNQFDFDSSLSTFKRHVDKKLSKQNKLVQIKL